METKEEATREKSFEKSLQNISEKHRAVFTKAREIIAYNDKYLPKEKKAGIFSGGRVKLAYFAKAFERWSGKPSKWEFTNFETYTHPPRRDMLVDYLNQLGNKGEVEETMEEMGNLIEQALANKANAEDISARLSIYPLMQPFVGEPSDQVDTTKLPL